MGKEVSLAGVKAPVALWLKGVGVKREGRWLLRGISMEVREGETCAVVGPNGCGKSTLLRVIEGYEFATEGEVWVLGRKLGETDVGELRKRVRLVGSAGSGSSGGGSGGGEGLDFPRGMMLREVVASGGRGHLVMYEAATGAEVRAAGRLLREVGLEGGIRWGVASAGERMRAMLARARMPVSGAGEQGGRVLLLDEPTANLDLAAREKVIAAMEAPGTETTQVIVTHHVEELPVGTGTVLVLGKGRAVAVGAAGRVLTGGNLSKAFGVPVRVGRRGGRWRAEVVG